MKISILINVLILSMIPIKNTWGMRAAHPLISKSHITQAISQKKILVPMEPRKAQFSSNESKLAKKWYLSKFAPPNETAKKILVAGQILAPNEKPHQMIERIANTIAETETAYFNVHQSNSQSTADFINRLGILMDEGAIVFSTPILTNAGRFHNRPLSACVVPPIDLRSDLKEIKQMVDQYHQDGMGTGFDLSDTKDPVTLLKHLNQIAVDGAASKKEQRPVGNMATLNVHCPAIEEFIMAKVGADNRGEKWIFNISVNITDDFMGAVKNNTNYTLNNGTKISAKKIFEKIAYAAHQCGDPGLISMTRLNADNPTPLLGEYTSTAPCAEVGLAPGETCIFGYINLAKILVKDPKPVIDFDKLKLIVNHLTRALDTILEYSIKKYTVRQSASIMSAKRKIGIGICGFADMLIALNISYTQHEARALLQDVLNFINYQSKIASIELAKGRGSFTAIYNSRYMDRSFLMRKYEKIGTTPHVSINQWEELAKYIQETRLLRNATTTSLPPTGRSALVIGASTGIEPLFSVHTSEGIYPPLYAFLEKNGLSKDLSIIAGIIKSGSAPKNMQSNQNLFITATEISPYDHLAMAIAAQGVIDESISKTINLPENTTPPEIEDIYLHAYSSGLKGISIFRNNSRSYQPKQLSIQKK